MSQIALITDTHVGIKSGNKVFLDYQEKFFTEIFFPEIKHRNIKHIVHLGDMVEHRKVISYYALNRMREFFIEPILSGDWRVDLIVGNHDTTFRNSNKINAQKELFGDDFVNIHIWDSPGELGQILFIPWVNEENREETVRLLNESSSNIMLGHLEVKGASMYRGVACEHGWSPSDFKKFKLVVSGHFHTREAKGNITYMGNAYHLTWADYGDPRGFAILDTDTCELEYVDNPNSLFHRLTYDGVEFNGDVLDIEDKYVKVEVTGDPDPEHFERAMGTIEDLKPLNVQLIDRRGMDTHAVDIDDPDDTMEVVEAYVRANVDKRRQDMVVEHLRELYTEAA